MFGSEVNDDITVSGVHAVASNAISGIVTLIATADDARVMFKGQSSTINALEVQADNGIDVHVDLLTDTGTLYLNGDYDAHGMGGMNNDTANTVSFNGNAKLSAVGALHINATASGIHRTGTELSL